MEAAAFIVGAVLGSFANVLIHRLPRGESIVAPGSRCPRCGTPIRPRDNVPLLSYLWLRGRCRSCRGRISARYPLVEAASGALTAGVVWRFGPTLSAARFEVMGLALIVAFCTDLERGVIPNAVTYPGIAIGLLFAGAAGRVVPALAAAAGAGAVFALAGLLSRGGMGGGDVKLAAMIGAFLGVPGVIVALFSAVVLGAAAGALLVAARLRTRKDTIPFGPALATGAMIAAFGSDAIVRWYLAKML